MNKNSSILDNPIVCIFLIIGSIAFMILLSYEPKPRICEKFGCDREADKDSVYCFVHNPNSEYNAESRRIMRTSHHTPGVCLIDGCNKSVVQGFSFCSSHKCAVSTCKLSRESGSNYCVNDTCSCRDCYRRVVDYENHRCEEHRLDRPIRTTSSSSSSHHSSSSSRVEWPDCDDYEDFDEFMDDWDGNMPDGSDAEDYWDNW